MTDENRQDVRHSHGVTLAGKKCVPCEVGSVPLTIQEAHKLNTELHEWTLSPDARKISKQFTFRDFAEVLAFVTKVGAIAEAEGHHPDIDLHWGKAGIELSTHAIGGLSVNDFIVAAKIDHL